MPDSVDDTSRAFDDFLSSFTPESDFTSSPEWSGLPVTESSSERALWINRGIFLSNARAVLDIGFTAGTMVTAALSAAADARYLGIETKSSPLARAWAHRLERHSGTKVQTRAGVPARLLAALPDHPSDVFDRVRINGADDYLACRAILLEALRLCSPAGLILVDACDQPHVNEAVVALLAAGGVHCVTLPGWAHGPEQVVLQRRPAGAEQAPANDDPARVILVAVFGAAVQAEWAFSRPSIAAYARRVGAELVECTGDLPPALRPLAKMVALDRLDRAARVLLLDTDIVIRDNAPDLFDIVPVDAVGLFLEGQIADRAANLRECLAWHGFSARKPFYGNTGVFLLPSHLTRRFALSSATTTLHIDEMYEQGYFNALLHALDFPVFNLSALFNCMPAVTPELRRQGYFIHFAGGSLGMQHSHVWQDAHDASSPVALRTRRVLNAKEMRLFDVRNESCLAAGLINHLVPASHLSCPGGMLSSENGYILLQLPATEGLLVWGPYIDLPPGRYVADVLVSESAFREAFLDLGGATQDTLIPVMADPETAPSSMRFGITAESATQVLVSHSDVPIHQGRARVFFTLHEPMHGIECHLYGCGEIFQLYGLRFQAMAPGFDQSEPPDAHSAGPSGLP